MVVCLERGANNLHMVQLMTLPPSSKIQNGLPLWCRVTEVVLENRPLNGCSSVVKSKLTLFAGAGVPADNSDLWPCLLYILLSLNFSPSSELYTVFHK